MNITLINPPQMFSKYQVASGVTPPLGLAYIASYCQRKHKVKIIDSVGKEPYTYTPYKDDISFRGMPILKIVCDVGHNTDIVGISNMFTFAYPSVLKLCEEIKNEYDIPIVLGGSHPSALPEKVLKSPFIDFVIISEGEKAFNDLCNGEDPSDIDGFAYKDDVKIIINPKKKFLDIDSIPVPSRELLPMESYFKTHEAHGPTKSRWTPIISSRGCPFECTFCTSKLWNRKWRGRSPENVVDEMEHCIKKYGIKEFHFEDENMTLKKDRTIKICNEIIERGLDINWQTPNGIRASVTDYEMLKKMKESGCNHITVAPESGSERVLNEIIRKHQDLDQVASVIKYAVDLNIKVAAYFILGLPGEKKEEIEKTISVACNFAKLGLDEVAFSLFIPIPGSELYDKVLTNDEDLLVMGDLTKTISWSEHLTTKDLGRARRKAYFMFHLSKLYYHPLRVLKSISNILTGKEETKTERTLRTFIRRNLA